MADRSAVRGDPASPRLQAALEYAAQGRRVIVLYSITETGACTCHNRDCKVPGKHPRITDWPQRATTAPATIRDWFARWPDSNVGVATGGGLVALDVDLKHDGPRRLAALIDNTGEPFADTPVVATGSDGRHYYFAGDAPSRVLTPGIELKGAGTLVVAPPSIHASGREYAWLVPPTMPLAPLPHWLRDLAGSDGGPRLPEHWAQLAREGVDLGSRNNTCASLAGHLIAHDVDARLAYELLRAWDAQRNRPPMGDAEVKRTVLSIAQAELRKRRASR